MQVYRRLIFSFVVVSLAGCFGSSGPVKTYDEATVKDTSKVSILYLPPAIELLEVNGMEYDTPFIETGKNEVHLLPGKHVLAVKYVKFWGDETSGSMVRSEPVIFNLDLKGKEKITMEYTRAKDQWAAQAMVKRFKPWLEDAQGKKLKTKGSQFFSGSLTLTSSAAGSAKAIASKEPLSELKFWWDKATHDEKQNFKKWLESDE